LSFSKTKSRGPPFFFPFPEEGKMDWKPAPGSPLYHALCLSPRIRARVLLPTRYGTFDCMYRFPFPPPCLAAYIAFVPEAIVDEYPPLSPNLNLYSNCDPATIRRMVVISSPFPSLFSPKGSGPATRSRGRIAPRNS